jgi:hypothetical protein
MASIAEIKRRADIRDVWAALGGGKLRGSRGQAFWRGGDGYSVALDPNRGLWHDFVAGEGGDVIALVEQVRECDFKAAAAWLAEFTGTDLSGSPRRSDYRPDTDWAADLRWAIWWARGAELYAEWVLEELPCWSSHRRGPTVLLQTIRLGDAVLVNEYREWRRRNPKLAAAIAHAGQRSDARLQRRLALWLRRYADAPEAA